MRLYSDGAREARPRLWALRSGKTKLFCNLSVNYFNKKIKTNIKFKNDCKINKKYYICE